MAASPTQDVKAEFPSADEEGRPVRQGINFALVKWRELWFVPLVVAAPLVFIFLPFLPGRYDSLAVPLFGIAQILGGTSWSSRRNNSWWSEPAGTTLNRR